METPLVIPDDLEACQALIAQLAQRVSEQGETILKQNEQLAEKDLTIAELLQGAVRKRSERYLNNPQQLKLDFGNTEEAADAADGLAEAIDEANQIVVEYRRQRRPARKARSGEFPAHFERYEVTAEMPESVRHCEEHGERKLIGYDRTETLEITPPQFKVRVTLYPKLVCQDAPECGVAQPPREPGLVEGNRYGTSVAATIITDKTGYHLPIYRHQDRFASSG